MAKRKKRPSQRQSSKIKRSDKRLVRTKLFIKGLVLAKAIWRLVKDLIGDDSWDSYPYDHANRRFI